jgi:alkaline phosphatase
VTSVPIPHATPACGYANNVSRDDYQDITRDMVSLRSVSHRGEPLPGLDVVIGCGFGGDTPDDSKQQGVNYEPGNKYVAPSTLAAIDAGKGGRYRIAQRTAGRKGADVLAEGAAAAIAGGERLFGIFGTKPGNLPFATADGGYADDGNRLKELLRTRGSLARVVAKIEKREAVDAMEAIVEAADVVMVARGDLGVEIDVATMPMVQKRIIRVCQRYQKPVIVATQMLDSMQHSRRPTRAEATDVANAILDGADACMLSGETAVGDFPRETVAMMNRIACSIEPLLADLEGFLRSRQAAVLLLRLRLQKPALLSCQNLKSCYWNFRRRYLPPSAICSADRRRRVSIV